jgi:uncharacterized membrane protein
MNGWSILDMCGFIIVMLMLILFIFTISIKQTEEINERFDRIEAAIAEQATAAETGSEENGGKP